MGVRLVIAVAFSLVVIASMPPYDGVSAILTGFDPMTSHNIGIKMV